MSNKITAPVNKYVVTKVSIGGGDPRDDYVLVRQTNGTNVLKLPLIMFKTFPEMNDIIHVNQFVMMGETKYRVISEKLKVEYNNNLVNVQENNSVVVHD